MKQLSKADFFAPRPPVVERVEIDLEGWQGFVHVRTLSGVERDGWEIARAKERESGQLGNVRAGLVALATCDESGKRLFTEDDARQLGHADARVLDIIFEAAARLNCIMGYQKEAKKNSESPTGSGSPSASPSD